MQKTAVRVLEAAFVTYPVKDVARARKFYEGIFQLKPTLENISEDTAWIEYDLPNTTFVIGMMEGWDPSKTGPGIAFEVEDFDKTVELLREEKVPFSIEPCDWPGCQMCMITDPDGNSLMIHKRKK